MFTITSYTIVYTLLVVVVCCSDYTGAMPVVASSSLHQGDHNTHITNIPLLSTNTSTQRNNSLYHLIGLLQLQLNSVLHNVRQVINDTQQPSTTCFVNPLAQNDSINVSVQLQQDLLSLVTFESVVSYIITTQYHNQSQQNHLLSNIKHDIQTTLTPMRNLTHQLTPNSVNTFPPHDDTQCWQQLNTTHILQSLMIQVTFTQRHLLTLLPNMENDNTSSTRGNTTLIVAYLTEARLHTYHTIQLQLLVSRRMNISSQTPLNGCYVSPSQTTNLPVNVLLRADLKSLHLLIIAIGRVISTQPANQTALLSELNRLRNDIINTATALSHLIDVLPLPSEAIQVPMPKSGGRCDRLTNEQIILTIKVQAVYTIQDLDTLSEVYMNNI